MEGETVLPVDPDTSGASGEPSARRSGHASRRATRVLVAVIACSGAVGALARYVAARLLPTAPGRFPWGTFWINVSGSAVIGFVLVLLLERFPRARLARPLVATGFLGAFTTFSTYMVDADELVRAHRVATAAVYALGSLLAGTAAVAVGMAAARTAVRIDASLDRQLGS